MNSQRTILVFNSNEILKKIIDSSSVYNNSYEKIINKKLLIELTVDYMSSMLLKFDEVYDVFLFMSPQLDWRKIYYSRIKDQYDGRNLPYKELEEHIVSRAVPIHCIKSKHSNMFDVIDKLKANKTNKIHCFSEDKTSVQFSSTDNITVYDFYGNALINKDVTELHRIVYKGDESKGIPSILSTLDYDLNRKRGVYIPDIRAKKLNINNIKESILCNKDKIKVVQRSSNLKQFPYVLISQNNYRERILASTVLLFSRYNPKFVKNESIKISNSMMQQCTSSNSFKSKYYDAKISI